MIQIIWNDFAIVSIWLKIIYYKVTINNNNKLYL